MFARLAGLIALSSIVGTSLVAASASAADMRDLQCTFRHPIDEVGSIEEVPRQIQNVMLAHMDPRAREDAKFEWHTVMAPRGAPFNATDVIVPGYAPLRFIRAGHTGTEWFVWYERGGLAYSKHILLFHLRLGHGVPVVRASMSYQSQDPCALTDDLLDGKQAPVGLEQDW